MPKQQGLWWQEWDNCDRCGFRHPLSLLTVQKGFLLCTDHNCLDNLTVERRPIVIANILDNSDGEMVSEKGRKREAVNPVDLEF